MARYIQTKDVAKLVRAELKKAFPGHRFSVRSDLYSGGSSVRVRWVDGPTEQAVEKIVKGYGGASFDGMIDLKSYHDSELKHDDGTVETVHFGADWITTNREMSLKTRQTIATWFLEESGIPLVDDNAYYFCIHRETGSLVINSYETTYGSMLRHQKFAITSYPETKEKLVSYYEDPEYKAAMV